MANIRLATTDDAAAIAGIYGPYCESTVISFEEGAPSADEMARRITAILATRPWIVLEDDRTIVGYAYASAHHERAAYRWSVSTAIYIDRACQRLGAGRALYTTLFELLRHLGYYTAVAGITVPNPASVGLHKAMGFELVGEYRDIGFKLGAWRNVAWYQAPIQQLAPAPREPRSIHELVGGSEWREAVDRGLVHYKHR